MASQLPANTQVLLRVFSQHEIHPSHHQHDLKIQTAEPAGKCLCGESTRLPVSADTAQSAAPPSKSARNEWNLNAVVGGEIDRGHVYCTPKRKAHEAASVLVLASCSSTRCMRYMYMPAHTGNNADFAMSAARLGRHASCGIFDAS